MIGQSTIPKFCQDDLCCRIKQRIASFITEESQLEQDTGYLSIKKLFLEMYDCYCFDGQFRKYVIRGNNPEESLRVEYDERLGNQEVQNNEFNQHIRRVYEQRKMQILRGFEEKQEAIKECRTYKGQNSIYASLLADRNQLMTELESQRATILTLIAENEGLKDQIKSNRSAIAGLEKKEQKEEHV